MLPGYDHRRVLMESFLKQNIAFIFYHLSFGGWSLSQLDRGQSINGWAKTWRRTLRDNLLTHYEMLFHFLSSENSLFAQMSNILMTQLSYIDCNLIYLHSFEKVQHILFLCLLLLQWPNSRLVCLFTCPFCSWAGPSPYLQSISSPISGPTSQENR